jgi:acetyl-CoA carboxylase biotin carboxyl carrier protein
MSDTLVCKTISEQHLINLLSPSIGRIKLEVFVNETIKCGQLIGWLWRLDKCFRLTMPTDCTGVITAIHGCNGLIALGYNEPLLTIDPRLSSADISPVTMSHTAQAGAYITSPMDGLFYLSSAPENPPFVKVGDSITPGQTLGLIEVMKSFYPVKYQGDKPAIITGITITTATPVHSGTNLFAIA